MSLKAHFKSLRGKDDGFSNYVTFLFILPLFLAVIVGGSYVAESLRMMSTLNHALTIVDNNMTQDGALTQNGQTQLISYLQGNGLDLNKVYLNATTTPQSFGSRGLQATIGYDLDLKAPGTSQVVWHKYYQATAPMVQSQFIPNSGADASGAVPLSAAFAGVKGGTDSGGLGSGSTPVNEATSMTLQASSTSPVVNASVTLSGKVYFGSNPAPTGTQVALSGGGVQQTVSTDSSGAYSANVTFAQTGTVTVQATSGAATANVSLTVQANTPGTISLQVPTTVQVAEHFTIAGTVLDSAGNPVMDGTKVTISSTDTADIPTTTVTTQNGNFSYAVNGSTSLNAFSVTASAGTATATQNVMVIPGNPKTMTLSVSPTRLAAGSTVTFSGQVLGPDGTPVAQGTGVSIQSKTDTVDTLPGAVTDANGNFSVSATLTQAGSQAFYAQTTGPMDSSTVTATVTPGSPYKVSGMMGTPNPVNMGANMAISGYVSDQYGNPVASGTPLQIVSSALPSPVSASVLSGAFNAKVTLQAPGVQTLMVEDGSGNALSGGSLSVNVLAAAAYSLTPAQEQYTVSAGQSISNIQFTLKDSNGQPVAGKTVQFSETPQGNSLVSPASAVTDSSGQVDVTVGPLTTAGSQTLVATLAGDTSVVGTVGITVSPGMPSELIANVAPSTTQLWTAQNPVPLPVVSGTVTDAYGNPVNAAQVTVSGGYGASASGTTDANGYYAIPIKPTNLGGPYALSFEVTSAYGSLSTTNGTITVITQPNISLKLQSSNGTPIGSQGEPYFVTASLTDQSGNPLNGTTVNLVSPTDGRASFNYVLPSTDTTGSFAPGETSESVLFSQTGNQVIQASCTIGGITLSSSINVYVAVPKLANILWTSVTPSTVVAGSSLSISGQALDTIGNPIRNIQTQIYFKEGGAGVQTLTTDSNGYFSTTLFPTGTGTKTLMVQIGNSVVQYPTAIVVNPGPPANIAVQLGYTAPLLTNNDTVQVELRVEDAYGNRIPNQSITLLASMPSYDTGWFSGGGSWVSNYIMSTSVITDSSGNASATFVTGNTAGTITFTAQDGPVNATNSVTDARAYAARVIIEQNPSSNPLINFPVQWDWASSNPTPYTWYDRTYTLEIKEYDQKNRPYDGNTTLNVNTTEWNYPISYQLTGLWIQDISNPSKTGQVGVNGYSSADYVLANGSALWSGSQYAQPYAWSYGVPMSSGIGTITIEEHFGSYGNYQGIDSLDGSNFSGNAYMSYTFNVNGTNYYYTTK